MRRRMKRANMLLVFSSVKMHIYMDIPKDEKSVLEALQTSSHTCYGWQQTKKAIPEIARAKSVRQMEMKILQRLQQRWRLLSREKINQHLHQHLRLLLLHLKRVCFSCSKISIVTNIIPASSKSTFQPISNSSQTIRRTKS